MRCVDLFAGCGGLTLGFENAGLTVVAAVDHWQKAVDVYSANFDHPCHIHDLTDVAGTLAIVEKYQPDLIMGGPPCQDFSSAGKRDVTLGRADLTLQFADVICNYRPQWFVMENVERIKKSKIIKQITDQFACAGYGLTAIVLDASYCGVPQARKRFFLIGEMGGQHNALHEIYQRKLTDKRMTVRDYLGDSLGIEFYYRHPRNYSRRGLYSIDEPSPTIRGVNRPVPKGYAKHRSDPAGASLDQVRPLTTVERSYLQTFPQTFRFEGSKTNLEQMIGNAVPVKLATFVAQGIIDLIKSRDGQKSVVYTPYQPALLPKVRSVFRIPTKTLQKS